MISVSAVRPSKREVWERLDLVMDPELDEPITEMGFVEDVVIGDDGGVEVTFRLPTYWCSPNFAFLMAEGIRREVSEIPWVAAVRVRLEDHMAADEMNAAVNEGRDFADVFAGLTDGGDLGDLREKFDGKAFQRRQETVINVLLKNGYLSRDLVRMTLAELDMINLDDPDWDRARLRYVDLLVSKAIARFPLDLAFQTYDGVPIAQDGFSKHMETLRGVRLNMEFSGALCRGLKKTRYKEVANCDGEPTLVDFILDRVPEPAEQGR
ncbi:metal-sulfur cluster assembly factor [Hoeflea sp. TYP-13]|uniref:metal-sulfur cluster assembly factor n=1 Tax=Hoeflea sp. TYP-13 TaxID=3230023 RepID=UPI0034C5BE61